MAPDVRDMFGARGQFTVSWRYVDWGRPVPGTQPGKFYPSYAIVPRVPAVASRMGSLRLCPTIPFSDVSTEEPLFRALDDLLGGACCAYRLCCAGAYVSDPAVC